MKKEKRKNIAFYIGDYTRSGGTERASIAVANGLSKRDDHRIILITTNNKNETSFFTIGENIEVIYLNIQSWKKEYLKLSKGLRKTLLNYKIDTFVVVETMVLLQILGLLVLGFFKKRNIILVVWEHFNFTVDLSKKLRQTCRKIAARYADQIVVLTQRDKELWETNLKVNAKITPIPNPSPFLVIASDYDVENKNIIAVGRLAYQKGFDRLIEIWKDYTSKYDLPKGWKLQIIGSGEDEVMLKELIKNYDLEETVEMIPNTKTIEEYYKNAAFMVMTSRFEGLPMTLIEAQSFGLPIIAYDCLTGPAEIISDDSGFLIEDGDSVNFMKKLATLLEKQEIRTNMSAAAQKEVSKFNKNDVVKKWGHL